jgi:hypothetical protein
MSMLRFANRAHTEAGAAELALLAQLLREQVEQLRARTAAGKTFRNTVLDYCDLMAIEANANLAHYERQKTKTVPTSKGKKRLRS